MNIRKKRNIINFDKADVRIECIKKHEILISIDIKEHYAINFENRQFIIVIETINAVDEYSFSSMLIIQNCEIMTNFFSKDLSKEIYIFTSIIDFTSDKIALKYLQHYIKNSNAELDAN